MRAAVLATGLGVEKRKRESARPAARGPTAKTGERLLVLGREQNSLKQPN
jgi:hypothetical protein